MRAWQAPRYERALESAVESLPYDVEDLKEVENPDEHISIEEDERDDDEETTDDETRHGSVEIAPFQDDELDVLQRHLGDVASATPRERKEALIAYLEQLEEHGIKLDAITDD